MNLTRKFILQPNDEGITMVELLIYLVITAFLSLGISRLTYDAAASLERASSESIAARQVVRFTNILKADVSGSKDIILNPTMTERCSLNPSGTSSVTYLFTAKIAEIYNTASFDDILGEKFATWALSSDTRVESNTKYLTRIVCTSSTGTPKSENLLALGKFSSAVSGLDFLYCSSGLSGANFNPCPIGSTNSNFSYYRFQIPSTLIVTDAINGKFSFSTLRKMFNSGGSSQVQSMARKVDEY
jgi:hypothetical protein